VRRRRRQTSPLLDLHTADRLVSAATQAALEQHDLSPRHLDLLSLVLAHGRLTPSELAEIVGSPATTIRDVVNTLVESGHARRRDNPEDARSYYVELTSKGEQLVFDASMVFRREVEDELERRLDWPLEELRPRLLELQRVLRELLDERGGAELRTRT
jgi:DNA-binding MarR family transcriptional regulator